MRVTRLTHCIVLGMVAATLLSTAPLASAARQPTTTERARIERTIKENMESSNPGTTRVRVWFVRVSTLNSRFAFAGVRMWTGGREVKGAGFLVQRGYLTGRWLVRIAGTSDVGCDIPRQIERDLRLECP